MKSAKHKKKKMDLDELANIVVKGFGAVAEDIADMRSDMTRMDGRLNEMDGRLTTMDGKLTSLTSEMHIGFSEVNRRLDTVIQAQLSDHAMRIKSLEEIVRK